MAASRLLLVEDEGLIRSLIGDGLRGEGYDVIEAETADAAAQLLNRELVDVLMTDVRMPGKLDGIDLAFYARSVSPRLPVLVVSGYAEQISGRLGALEQPIAFVAKPYVIGQILGSLRKLIGSRRELL